MRLHCMWLQAAMLLILLGWGVASADSDAGCSRSPTRRWCKYSEQCIDESAALTRWDTASVHGCVLKASSTADDLLAQWNKQTGVCSLFHYQQVCRLISGSSASGAATATAHCSVYRAAALVSCAASLNAALLGVWLAGGSSRFSNLVCQSEPTNYRLVSVNLQWTEEGANFNGVSSYALLNDSRLVADAANSSFTWLMRLKRQPRVQPFLELVSCSDFSVRGHHFWEFQYSNRLYCNAYGRDTDFWFFSSENLLPNDTSSWVNIGVVVDRTSDKSAFFFNQGFVNITATQSPNVPLASCYLLAVGRRFTGGGNYLQGVVQAVAVANITMTEQEIRDFFAQLP